MRSLHLALLLCCAPTGLATCSTNVNRSVCEGFQARVRVVDPLAEQKMVHDHASCEAYEAERARLMKQRPQ